MKRIKYGRLLILLLGILAMLGILIGYKRVNEFYFTIDEDGLLQIQSEQEWEYIKAWESDDVYYFFLPSYANIDDIRFRDGRISVNNEEISRWRWKFPYNTVCHLELQADDEKIWQGNVCFMKSANIPALHIEMAEAELERILSDKELNGAADITLVEANGSINYKGALEYISGRGNSSWENDKKSFALRLAAAYPLLSMDSVDSWVIIANATEGTKISYKMTMDIARKMGMNYVSEMEWVDVYINGEYQGNYLLAEKVAVGDEQIEVEDMNKPNKIALGEKVPELFADNYYKAYEIEENPQNITGGYLIEKDLVERYQEETCGFATKRLQTFVIKHPSIVTRAEADYITGFVQIIDDLLAVGDEAVLQFIDKESFYRKYILDEVTLNYDSNVTSAYFYKYRDKNILYAGPPWDYDHDYCQLMGRWMNYTDSVLDINAIRNKDNLSLDWNRELLSIGTCQDEMIQEYERALPLYQYYLEEGIDTYKDTIYESIQMDMTRWDYKKNRAGYYCDYNNIIRYMKYYLTNRLTYLNTQWGVECEFPELETTDAVHEVQIQVEDETVTLQIPDGQCVRRDALPELSETYSGYIYERDASEFNPYLPVFEEQIIVAKLKEE